MNIALSSMYASAQQKALFEDGIPAASFANPDVDAEHRRLADLGVAFRMEPFQAGGTILASFGNRCGKLIRIHQA